MRLHAREDIDNSIITQIAWYYGWVVATWRKPGAKGTVGYFSLFTGGILEIEGYETAFDLM